MDHEIASLRALESSGINSKSSSLMGTEISLIARFNSLLGRKRFPVRVRRKLGRKRLMVLPVLPSLSADEPRIGENSLFISLLAGNFNRDEFAADSPPAVSLQTFGSWQASSASDGGGH